MEVRTRLEEGRAGVGAVRQRKAGSDQCGGNAEVSG